MTALPTRKLEAYRYADFDALKSMWTSLPAPERIEIAAQQMLQQIWLPGGDEVQVRRVEIALEAGASCTHFRAQHCARIWPHRARRDARRRRRFRAARGQHRRRQFDARNRHHRPPPRARRDLAPDGPQRARRQGDRLLSRQGRGRARSRSRPTASNRSKRCCSTAAPPPIASPSSKSSPTTSNARTARRSASSTATQLFYAARARPRSGERPRAAARRLHRRAVGRCRRRRSRHRRRCARAALRAIA